MNETTVKVIENFEDRAGAVTVHEPPSKDSFLSTIERIASNPKMDIEVIKYLFTEKKEAIEREEKHLYNAAFVRVQKKLSAVLKNKYNEQTKSSYADLSAVVETIREAYTSEGFAVSFQEGFSTPDNKIPEGYIRMIADVMHEGGHTEVKMADIPLDKTGIAGKTNKTDTHAKGSSFSYGRRYMTCMIFHVSTMDDDDGNAAGGKVVEYITTDMQTEISDLLNSSKDPKGDEKKLLKWQRVDSIDKILASSYTDIINQMKGSGK